MKTKPKEPTAAAELRRHAETELKHRKPDADRQQTPLETTRLVHELQVHQIELEMQNEALLQSRTELATERDRYADLYDFAPVGYLTLRPDGTITHANLAAASLLGVERSRLLNYRVALFIAPETRAAFADFLSRAFASKCPETGEAQLTRDGQPPVTVQLQACASADGAECRLAVTDISVRQSAEAEALRLSEQQWRAPFEAITDAVALLDGQGRILQCNQAMEHLVGKPKAAVCGRFYFEVVHGTAQPVAGCPLVRSKATKRREHMEFSLGERSLLVTVDPMLTADGQFTGAVHVVSDVTERKRAEAALRESEERFRILVEGAGDGFELIDDEGRFRDCNSKTLRDLGYTREELLHLTIFDIDPRLSREQFRAGKESLARGVPFRVESVHRRKDGSLFPVEVTVSRVQFGGLPHDLTLVRDITERKQAEEALRQTEERYHLLVENAPDGIGVFQDGKLVFVNPAGLRQSGMTDPAELLGRTLEQIVHPDDYADALNRLQRRLAGEMGVYPAEVRYLRLDGTILTVEVATMPILYGGKPALQFLVRDITARKQAEAALRAETVRRRALFEQSPDGIVIIEPQTARILEFNSAAHRQLGYSREEFARLSIPDVEARETPAETGARIAAVLQEGRADFETLQRTREGEIRDVHVTAQIVNVDGESVYQCIWRDITEHKRLEERLRQSQKMEAIGHLAGGMAHEFNNILAALMMNLGAIKMFGPAPEHREELDEIEALSQRAASLVKQLLAFSRQSIIRRERLDLAALVAHQSKMLARLFGARIRLELDLANPPTWVEADPTSLEQVVLNLSINARDAMKEGGVLRLGLTPLEVSAATAAAHPEVQPGQFVCLSVTDTGCGMTPEIQQRLFEPFFTTKDVGQGTGLGLATVRGMVEQHHGWVEAESSVGVGSTFRVYLPAAAAPRTALPAAPPAKMVRGEGTILVVEDEPALLKVSARLLTHNGYTVLIAADGAEALAVWAEHRAKIDLLLTDMVMPGQWNGQQLAERLRADKPSLPVIITSGYNTEFMELGEDPATIIVYLPKPCPAEILTRVIKTCLHREDAGPAAGADARAETK